MKTNEIAVYKSEIKDFIFSKILCAGTTFLLCPLFGINKIFSESNFSIEMQMAEIFI